VTLRPSPAEFALFQFETRFGPGAEAIVISAPGRVNLIGEHIDYHNLPVLPMAIQRRIWIVFRPRRDARLSVISAGGYGEREFSLTRERDPGAAGDWANYLKAAAQAAGRRWELVRGLDASIASDLPAAAGLSSSSALLVGFMLALLQTNCILATQQELMDILPEGEQFVGTRGGAMDHAVILAGREGAALLVRFAPLECTPIPVPDGWSFLVAHSLEVAEKSGPLRAEYNARRAAGERAMAALGFQSFRAALDRCSASELQTRARTALAHGRLDALEFRAFSHVVSEAERVEDAAAALRGGEPEAFGKLMLASHMSLRDELRVSSPVLDELVEKAMAAGALGARLTGAGFGGCAVVLCRIEERDRICSRLVESYYSKRASFDPDVHLIPAEPSAGALYDTSHHAAAPQAEVGVDA
jgi:galactokinase